MTLKVSKSLDHQIRQHTYQAIACRIDALDEVSEGKRVLCFTYIKKFTPVDAFVVAVDCWM